MFLREPFEKLDAAIRALICKDTPLQDRLDSAIAEVTLLKENDFPPDLRAEFSQLMDRIHAYQGSRDRSDIQVDIALAILALFKDLVAFTGMVSKKIGQ